MKTKFIFFDLGNVLLRFSPERAARQGAAVAGCDEITVLQAVYGNGNNRKIECGEATEQEFYEQFCSLTGTRPDFEALKNALNDIFQVLEETQPFVRRLAAQNFPRGILSNVGAAHWNYCTATYPFLLEWFPENHVLSYRVGAMKPERKIFEAAFETAKKTLPEIRASEILFIDDLESNVLGAREFGFDAVPFVSVEQLATEIERRSLGPLNGSD